MKKIILISMLLILYSCVESNESEEVECNCTKTSYQRVFPNASNGSFVRTLGSENVPCQEQESFIRQSSESNADFYYTICCDNIDNSIAGVCRD